MKPILLLLLTSCLLGCQDDANKQISAEQAVSSSSSTLYPLDDQLRVNHIQAKGTHNSYHLATSSPSQRKRKNPYSMPSLTTQLEKHGIRQLELDLHYNDKREIEVFHGSSDPGTTCLALSDCLSEIKAWSDKNPGHHILFVWIEVKDKQIDDWDALDSEFRAVWPEDRLLTPDDVQGNAPSLRHALTTHGWPSLGQTRQKIMFAMNDIDQQAEDYSKDHTSLTGRVMFVRTPKTDSPIASIFKHGTHQEKQMALKANMIIGENAGTAKSNDEKAPGEVEAALSAGTHFVSSDYPGVVSGRTFYLQIQGGSPSRCHPITAPTECRSEDIENIYRF